MTEINPEMVRLARESRGRQQKEVAEALGIKQPTYSKVENGLSGLTDEQVAALSQYLEFPVSFFSQQDRIWGTASPHHRKRKTLPVLKLQEIEAQLNVVRLQMRRMLVNVHLDSPFSVPAVDLDMFAPAEAAQEVRRLWRVPAGPITNMTRLMEDAGVVLLRWEMVPKFDAITVQGPGEAPVVLCNAQFPVARQRFSLAHELGHICMHLYAVSEDPEREADEFAGEFLMPAREIKPELRDLSLYTLPDLKRRWRASMRAIVFHAQRIEAIDQRRARYLYMKLNQEYGGRSEPLEPPDEPPTLAREIINRHFQDLDYSVESLASMANSWTTHFMAQHDLRPPGLRGL